MTNPDRPVPAVDDNNRPFLDGWREGRLMLQRAKGARGRPFFYPRPVCPYTGSRDLEWFEASGRGRIVGYSLVLRPNHPAFNDEIPIILAEIELDEGATMLARILAQASDVASGQRVTLDRSADPDRYPMPVFVIDG